MISGKETYMQISAFIYALHSCMANYSVPTVFVDLFDCNKTKGRICYFSTQYENWRPDSKDFPKEAIGNKLGDWLGENWVDYRNNKVKSILLARLDKAKAKGCLGVDPDNVDGHTVNTGFKLTASDQKTFITWLSSEARKRGLLIGLKNSSETAKSLTSLVDFHVSEECTNYKECDKYPTGKTYYIEYMPVNKNICKVRPNTLFADIELKRFEYCVNKQ
jgi:hypothetical protein